MCATCMGLHMGLYYGHPQDFCLVLFLLAVLEGRLKSARQGKFHFQTPIKSHQHEINEDKSNRHVNIAKESPGGLNPAQRTVGN